MKFIQNETKKEEVIEKDEIEDRILPEGSAVSIEEGNSSCFALNDEYVWVVSVVNGIADVEYRRRDSL